MREIHIDNKNYGQRIDKYLLRYFPQMPKSFLYKMFRKKNICLNKKKISGQEILASGDKIQVFFAEGTFAKFHESKRVTGQRSFEIIYEDEDMIAVNKPIGLLSQPNGKDPNLVDQLATYLPADTRFGLVSRLDRNTSGLVIAGKNIQSLQYLNQVAMQKTYHAIVQGKLNQKLVLKDQLAKQAGHNKVDIYLQADLSQDKDKPGPKTKEIITKVRPLDHKGQYSLVEVEIENGKTHQIRAHLARIGHALVGDYKYGQSTQNQDFRQQYGLTYQLLHCYQITWHQGKLIAPYPDLFARIVKDYFSHS